jgi:hypothetical protein
MGEQRKLGDAEVRELTRKLTRRGWTVQFASGKGKARLYGPDGEFVDTLPNSPSNHRWKRTLRAKIRRAGYETTAREV